MADTQSLPKQAKTDAEFEQLCGFLLGETGWVQSADQTFGVTPKNVDKVRSLLDRVKIYVPNKQHNNWNQANEFRLVGSTSATIKDWGSDKGWQELKQVSGKKEVLAKRGLFDFFRTQGKEFDTSLHLDGEPYSTSRRYPEKPNVETVVTKWPKTVSSGLYYGLKDFDVKDGAIPFYERPDSDIYSAASQLGKQDWDHFRDVRATKEIFSNTGLALRQSLDMIDHHARLRVAKTLEPKATAERLKELAYALPETKEVKEQLKEVQGEYRAFLVNFKDTFKLTRDVAKDIKTLEDYVAKQPEGSVSREVATQILTEYRTVQATLEKAREGTVPHEGPNKGKKWCDLPGYEYLKAKAPSGQSVTLCSSTLFKLHSDPDTRHMFLDSGKDGETNTGWLWVAEFAGFDQSTLAAVLDPAQRDANTALSQTCRFLGSNQEALYTQALFDPDLAEDKRSDMLTQIVDLGRMKTALTAPDKSELKEYAYFASGAFKAQFMTPEATQAKRQMGVYKLCMATNSGLSVVSKDQLTYIVECLKSGQYKDELASLGITRSDYQEIQTLLSKPEETRINEANANALSAHFTKLVEKFGKDGMITRDQLVMASCPMEIKVEPHGVTYNVMNAKGEYVTVGTVKADHPAYQNAKKFAEQYSPLNKQFDACIQELCKFDEKPGTCYIQNLAPNGGSFCVAFPTALTLGGPNAPSGLMPLSPKSVVGEAVASSTTYIAAPVQAQPLGLRVFASP